MTRKKGTGIGLECTGQLWTCQVRTHAQRSERTCCFPFPRRSTSCGFRLDSKRSCWIHADVGPRVRCDITRALWNPGSRVLCWITHPAHGSVTGLYTSTVAYTGNSNASRLHPIWRANRSGSSVPVLWTFDASSVSWSYGPWPRR